mmetsp:Transcript_30553/g.88725  ORF Transcript_30553/g.88725 Transcript_30553/m.88725 type:complete len:298 (-) Transcript_30553:2506-3399(-)
MIGRKNSTDAPPSATRNGTNRSSVLMSGARNTSQDTTKAPCGARAKQKRRDRSRVSSKTSSLVTPNQRSKMEHRNAWIRGIHPVDRCTGTGARFHPSDCCTQTPYAATSATKNKNDEKTRILDRRRKTHTLTASPEDTPSPKAQQQGGPRIHSARGKRKKRQGEKKKKEGMRTLYSQGGDVIGQPKPTSSTARALPEDGVLECAQRRTKAQLSVRESQLGAEYPGEAAPRLVVVAWRVGRTQPGGASRWRGTRTLLRYCRPRYSLCPRSDCSICRSSPPSAALQSASPGTSYIDEMS